MRRAPNIEWKNAKGLDTWPFKALFCLNLAKTARLIHHRSVCLHLKSFKQFIFCSDSICLFHRYYQRFLLHQKICCTDKKLFPTLSQKVFNSHSVPLFLCFFTTLYIWEFSFSPFYLHTPQSYFSFYLSYSVSLSLTLRQVPFSTVFSLLLFYRYTFLLLSFLLTFHLHHTHSHTSNVHNLFS